MSAAILERDIQGEEVNSARVGEEACRRKIVALREGVRNVFNGHGALISQGASNADLVASIAQFCGKPLPEYPEHLDASWKEEYESFAQSVGSLMGEGTFTADTEPGEIVQAVQSRYMPDEKKEK